MGISKSEENWMKQWATLISNQQGITGSSGPIGPAGNPFVSQDHLGIEHPISLLPLSIKIATQTLGTDLVSVQPLSVPKGILHYIDFEMKTLQNHLGIELEL